jgi:23S rRNA pseudouridine2605 synthase
LWFRVEPARHEVCLDGEPVKPQPKRYYLLNKPPGCVCTHRDPAGRPRAIDLVPQSDARLFTVGRLDENSEGLLLVTNDGRLAQRLAHPRYHVRRVYHVQVAGRPTPETLAQLQNGIHFAEGKFRVQKARRLRSQGKSTFLELELNQGRNREIRRLLARVGHKVLRLERIAFGPLRLGRLPVGRCRPLTAAEIKAVRDLAEHRHAARRKKHPRRKAKSTARRNSAKPAK